VYREHLVLSASCWEKSHSPLAKGGSGICHIQQSAAVNEREIGLSSNDIRPLASCTAQFTVSLFQHLHKQDTSWHSSFFSLRSVICIPDACF